MSASAHRSSPLRLWSDGVRPEAAPIVAAGAAAVVVVVAALLVSGGVLRVSWGAACAVVMTCALAALAAHSALRAGRRAAGIERRVWRLFAFGFLSWALGVVPYLVFLIDGGDLRSPTAFSQMGFLLAYPFWYRALWLVREPVVGANRLQQVETWLMELAVLSLAGATAAGALWHDELSALANVAQMVPLGLDLLLLHAVYSAVRRSAVTHRTAFVWLAYGFAALAVTDAAVTMLVANAPVPVLAVAMLGYAAAMCLMTIAALRPLRVSEAQTMLCRSPALLAALGVGLSVVATMVVPESPVRLATFLLGAALFVRMWMLIGRTGQSETDSLTGFLERRAFARHLAGVAQLADRERPAALIAIEICSFGAWSARHANAENDRALEHLASALDASALERGVWGRLGVDRMAWVGRVDGTEHARSLAQTAQASAAAGSPTGNARAAFVVVPADALEGGDALAAGEEALTAARAAGRAVVAFDRGHLDGIQHSGNYASEFDRRRDIVLDIFRRRAAIEIALQPIVSLSDGRVAGYESLGRISLTPQRGPDKWLEEAHAVGLGVELEVALVRQALARRAELPDGCALSVNVGPDVMLTPELADALGEHDLEGVIIEITEHEAVRDYTRLAARLADFRGRGARIAIDDAGAGHSSMRHIAQLAPDFIKLDRSFVHDLDVDHVRRALVRSFMSLEPELGTIVIAEGIERPGELSALRELGVPLGQGYLLGRPQVEVSDGGEVAGWDGLVGVE